MITRCLIVCLVGLALHQAVADEPDPRSVPLAAENLRYLQVDLPVEERVADLTGRMTLEEKAIALNHNGPDLKRFGLRRLINTDNRMIIAVPSRQPTCVDCDDIDQLFGTHHSLGQIP